MKRFIVLMSDGDERPISIQTDDILETVESIKTNGYDIGHHDSDEIVSILVEEKFIPSEDGSRSLTLIDTYDVDYDTKM